MAALRNEDTCSGPDEETEDPGAAPYGNFINYYTFNPPENRLSLIPSTLLEDVGYQADTEALLLLLDVGCNSGVRNNNEAEVGSKIINTMRKNTFNIFYLSL